MRAFAILALVLVACAAPVVVSAQKPVSPPVRLTFTEPPLMSVGDEVTTTITLTAMQNLQRLGIVVRSLEGLVVLSPSREATFANVQRGEQRVFNVTVRLTAGRGTLAVDYTTLRSGTQDSATIAIEYSGGQ